MSFRKEDHYLRNRFLVALISSVTLFLSVSVLCITSQLLEIGKEIRYLEENTNWSAEDKWLYNKFLQEREEIKENSIIGYFMVEFGRSVKLNYIRCAIIAVAYIAVWFIAILYFLISKVLLKRFSRFIYRKLKKSFQRQKMYTS